MKKILFLIVTVLLSNMSFGQNFQFQVPDFFRMRIKSIDEFMDRFSRKELPSMLDSTDSDLQYKQVVVCFCMDSVRHRADEVVEFAHYMVDNNIQLSYEEPNYYCALRCKAYYKGRETSIALQMIVEQSDRGYYSWVIAGAEGDVLRLTPERISSSMKLSPADNLQDFAELQGMLQNSPSDVANYICRGRPIDETSVFVSLVSNGFLKIEGIEDIEYVFSAGDYIFKVKFFNRETNNNGWLIYDFYKKYD